MQSKPHAPAISLHFCRFLPPSGVSRASVWSQVLVFINTKKNADMLGRQLEQAGFPSGVLHGGKTQARNRRNCRCGGARCCSCCVTPWAPFTVAEHGHERQK